MLLQCVETFYYAASGSERPLVIDGMVCLLDVDVTKCRIGPAASCTYSIRKMVSTIGSIVCSCCGHRRLVRRHIRRWESRHGCGHGRDPVAPMRWRAANAGAQPLCCRTGRERETAGQQWRHGKGLRALREQPFFLHPCFGFGRRQEVSRGRLQWSKLEDLIGDQTVNFFYDDVVMTCFHANRRQFHAS